MGQQLFYMLESENITSTKGARVKIDIAPVSPNQYMELNNDSVRSSPRKKPAFSQDLELEGGQIDT